MWNNLSLILTFRTVPKPSSFTWLTWLRTLIDFNKKFRIRSDWAFFLSIYKKWNTKRSILWKTYVRNLNKKCLTTSRNTRMLSIFGLIRNLLVFDNKYTTSMILWGFTRVSRKFKMSLIRRKTSATIWGTSTKPCTITKYNQKRGSNFKSRPLKPRINSNS
jgi:hypothetical protein